jgi:hypothetical protein
MNLMRCLFLIWLIIFSAVGWAQSSAPSSGAAPSSQSTEQSPVQPPSSATPDATPAKPRVPNLTPPRADSVNADALDDSGESSSKSTQVDLTPPADDAKAHPQSSEVLMDENAGNSDLGALHLFNPHRAAKDVEVGDFYFKRKNYAAAEDRYREALLYKDNDAVATFRLAVCLEKLERLDEAGREYEKYLKILPHGPQAGEAQKAIERLKSPAASAKPGK